MAGIKKIELASANGPVTVEIVIGQAQFGRYELALYDTEGKNPVVIGEGISSDDKVDSFVMDQAVADLDGRFLSWSANLIPVGGEQNPRYSVILHVTQQSDERPGAPIVEEGELKEPRAIFGFARLEVV